jgi:hypothetical protein
MEHDLVAGDAGIDRGHDIAPLVTDLMKIGVADAAEENLELHVAFGRIAPWNRGGGQWRCFCTPFLRRSLAGWPDGRFA